MLTSSSHADGKLLIRICSGRTGPVQQRQGIGDSCEAAPFVFDHIFTAFIKSYAAIVARVSPILSNQIPSHFHSRLHFRPLWVRLMALMALASSFSIV